MSDFPHNKTLADEAIGILQRLDSAEFRELAVKASRVATASLTRHEVADRVSAAGGGRRSPERRSCGALRRVDCGYCSSRHRDLTGDGGYGTGIWRGA
jgi:hypothetical protein